MEKFFLDPPRCKEVLRSMLLSRLTDEKMSKLVRQNKGATFQLSAAGHELVGVVAAKGLIPGKDWGLAYYRDQPFAIGLGCDLKDIFGAFLARAVPHHSGGRMMPGHFSHKQLRMPCQSSVVGSQFLQAVGVAQGIKLAGKDEVVYVSAGEGATSQGDFHEALNFSGLHRLPVIFVIQDNGWAISVHVTEQTAGGSIVPVVRGHSGVEGIEVSGTSYIEMSFAMHQAVERARAGHGPTVIVATVPRLAAHSSSDDPLKYKSPLHIQQDKERDPIPLFEQFLLSKSILTQDEMAKLKEQAFKEVEQAALEAEKVPFPTQESVGDHLFENEPTFPTSKEPFSEEKIVIMDALNHAIDEEMGRDPGVIVFGQDVAHGKGGVFGITRKLTEKYGVKRCFNTPLAESTIVGLSIGLSLNGFYHPVAEVQFADYLWTGINQLFNELSSFNYRSNGEWNCPVVIRTPCGGYIQGGPYHSQSIEAYLSHCPGLIVVLPSNAEDAKGLLKTAIRSPNPVVFLEHKALYRQQKYCARAEPPADFLIPFGKARIVKEGKDLTIVAWGITVLMAVDVQERLAKEGVSLEIIDLRTLVPFDEETVLASIEKTGKLLIAHEAPRTCGFGAEVAARMAEKAFLSLDAPIKRVCGLDLPVPYCKDLENLVLPQTLDLEKAVRDLVLF